MTHPLIARHLERGQLKPLYLFFGEEEFLVDRACRRLEEALREKSGEAPHKVVLSSAETGLAEFLGEARLAPLWGAGQLLILRRVEAYPDETLALIPPYLKHPAPRSTVVLTAPGLKAQKMEKHPVWSLLLKNEMAVGFGRLREGDLLPWLAQEAKALGKVLSPAAAQRLVEVVGQNLGDLSQELQKLALFAGEERHLTPALVDQLATHSRTYTIFALVEALGERSSQRRLQALAQLLDLGEPPLKILTMLARQIRLLLRVKEAPPGTSAPDLARSVNLAPFLVRKLERQAAAFSRRALLRHLTRLHQADLMLKTGASSPRLWLECLVLEMGPG